MMMGRVIISTRKGYLGDVLNDDLAYLVPEGSVTAIVEALRRIADHPEEARAKADRARAALLAHYTSDVLYPQLVAVYDRCLGLPPEPAAPAP
jgi:glycosyltransferase involved in cell wall biosynthesis